MRVLEQVDDDIRRIGSGTSLLGEKWGCTGFFDESIALDTKITRVLP